MIVVLHGLTRTKRVGRAKSTWAHRLFGQLIAWMLPTKVGTPSVYFGRHDLPRLVNVSCLLPLDSLQTYNAFVRRASREGAGSPEPVREIWEKGGRMVRGKWMKTGIGLLLMALLVVPIAAAGCGGTSGMTLTSGKLTMGSDTSYPPFESKDENNKTVGFDVELAQAIAKKMGLTLEVVSTAWDGIIPGLKTNKYDVIMSAMTITPERQKEINFSDPYIDSDQSMAVANDSTIKTEADLKDKVVGVQIDTTGQTKAEELKPKVGIKEIQKFDTILVAFEALEQGKIDAIINDFPVNAYVSAKRGKTKVATKIKTNEQYGIGVNMDNKKLLDSINKALGEVRDDGTYTTIYKKWFGVAPPTE